MTPARIADLVGSGLLLGMWACLAILVVRALWRGQPSLPEESPAEPETVESAARRVC